MAEADGSDDAAASIVKISEYENAHVVDKDKTGSAFAIVIGVRDRALKIVVFLGLGQTQIPIVKNIEAVRSLKSENIGSG